MEMGSLAGLLLGVIALSAAIMTGGHGLRGFLDPVSALLVVGCTLAATLINYPRVQIVQAMRDAARVFQSRRQSRAQIASLLATLSQQAKREGVLALETEIGELPLGILRRGIQRVVDGTVPDTLAEYLELEIDMIEEQAARSIEVLTSMAGYFPAFGMIGTVVGLVKMLLTMKDPSSLGASMGLALVTTFYGAAMANLVCLPIAGRLQSRCDDDLLLGRMVARGVMAISAGENPSIIEETLSVFDLSVGDAGQLNEEEYEPDAAMKAGVQ